MEGVLIICIGRDIWIMRDDDDGRLGFALEGHHEIHDHDCVGMIEIAGGFICQEEWKLSDKCSRYCHSLLLTTTELMWISPAVSWEADLGEDFVCFESSGDTRDIYHEVDIVCDGEVGYQMELLKNKRHMLRSSACTLIFS
jgi:hypothetical protein